MEKLHPSSPAMLNKITTTKDEFGTTVDVNGNTKYPFQMMRIGESFVIPLDPSAIYSVRMTAYYHTKKTGKKFAIIRHHEHNCAEVGRIK